MSTDAFTLPWERENPAQALAQTQIAGLPTEWVDPAGWDGTYVAKQAVVSLDALSPGAKAVIAVRGIIEPAKGVKALEAVSLGVGEVCFNTPPAEYGSLFAASSPQLDLDETNTLLQIANALELKDGLGIAPPKHEALEGEDIQICFQAEMPPKWEL